MMQRNDGFIDLNSKLLSVLPSEELVTPLFFLPRPISNDHSQGESVLLKLSKEKLSSNGELSKSLHSTFGQRTSLIPFDFVFSKINETGTGIIGMDGGNYQSFIPQIRDPDPARLYTLRFDLYGRDYCLDVSFRPGWGCKTRLATTVNSRDFFPLGGARLQEIQPVH